MKNLEEMVNWGRVKKNIEAKLNNIIGTKQYIFIIRTVSVTRNIVDRN